MLLELEVVVTVRNASERQNGVRGPRNRVRSRRNGLRSRRNRMRSRHNGLRSGRNRMRSRRRALRSRRNGMRGRRNRMRGRRKAMRSRRNGLRNDRTRMPSRRRPLEGRRMASPGGTRASGRLLEGHRELQVLLGEGLTVGGDEEGGQRADGDAPPESLRFTAVKLRFLQALGAGFQISAWGKKACHPSQKERWPGRRGRGARRARREAVAAPMEGANGAARRSTTGRRRCG